MEEVLLIVTSVPFKFDPDKVKDCALEVELTQTLPKLLLIVPAVNIGLVFDKVVTPALVDDQADEPCAFTAFIR